ncbi:MAG: hypothetical protein IJX16_00970 [Clostridia bacterium]|nr:hypothetical protein [Clostridia bacterium]
MRRKFLTFITIILAMIISVSSLSACKLITTDNERDMNQVVATVQINDEAPFDEIYKRDMIMAYLNYGYMYEQYYSYTRTQVFNMIIKNLIENRVYVQNAMEEFEGDDEKFDITLNTEKAKWDLDRYLTADEITNAEYLSKKSINELIDSYEKSEDEENKESLTETVRTAPTDAANAEKEEPTPTEQAEYQIDANSTSERRKAYNKVIKLLENNELLGKNYNGDIKTSQYYLDTVINYKETKLLEKYEDCIRKDIFSNVDFDQIKDAYEVKYNKQSEWTNAEFVSALSSASAADPILVSNGTGYGYVYNLLLGASTEQTTAISNIDKKISIAEKAQQRKVILDEIKVKDLRSSWILSGYDFDGAKFTGDYTFTSPENSLAFKGAVTKLKDATEDDPAEYKIDNVTEYNLNDFIALMENYVYGKSMTAVADTNPSIYKKVNATEALDEYDERINELLFAFSTDEGSLNTYKGYAIKPIPDGSNSEEYMQEFADAGRELLKMGDKSYIIAATDYGYHVMFYSEVFNDSYDYDNLLSYLETFDSSKDWAQEFTDMMANYEDYADKDGYLFLLTDSVISTEVTNTMTDKQRKILNKYVYNENTCGVVRYESRYADLLV